MYSNHNIQWWLLKTSFLRRKDKGFGLISWWVARRRCPWLHKSPLSMRSFSTDYLPVELIYKSKMLPTETAHTALNWFLNGEYLDSSPILHIWIVYLSNFDKCINFYQLQESNKGIQHRPRLSTPVMENSCLLFCSCHLELFWLNQL